MKKYLLLICFFILYVLPSIAQVDSLKRDKFVVSIAITTGTIKWEADFPFQSTYFIGTKSRVNLLYKNGLVEKISLINIVELKYISTNIIYNYGFGLNSYSTNYADIFDIKSYLEVNKYIFDRFFSKKIKPFIGAKIFYLYRNIKDGYYEDAITIENTINTNTFSLQAPIGLSYSYKHFYSSIQFDLSLITFITGNYNSELSGSNVLHSPPDPHINYFEVEKGNYNKILLTNNLIKDNYFINRCMLKIGYQFNKKRKV